MSLQDQSFCFIVPNDKTKLTLAASSIPEKEQWIAAFQQALGHEEESGSDSLQQYKKIEEEISREITFTKVRKVPSQDTITRPRRATITDIFQ